MDSTQVGWWRRHGWTLALLLSAFGFTLLINTVWQYPIIAQYGALYTYAGGSDSYYHSRVMAYIIMTHHNLVFDPMLKFPIGAINPREPLFDWLNAVLGILFAPLFGGNAVAAGAWFLDMEPPLWAALGVFPLYLIGREVSGRRMGLIACLIFPFMTATIDSGTFGYANYLTFYTFFVMVLVYAYLRTLKAVGSRRWIESYRKPGQYIPGIRAFLRTERTAVKWSVFTGVCLGALALAWQGYTYGVALIGVTLLVAMLVERIHKVDSFGLYVSTWIIGLVAFPMCAPYYIVQGEIDLFLEVPILLFFGVLLILLPFLLMRDIPWVFSIPALVAFVGAAAIFLKLVFPRYFTDVVTGQGYFVKNLIYSTIAEAQAPSVDALVIGYGVFTFFLAFVGLALFGYFLARGRFKRYLIAFMVFSIISIYLPISAAKFFVVGAPAFALLSAEALHRALDVGGYPALRRTVASLSDRGGRAAAFRKAFKARHVLVLALVVALILPNVWLSVDAGIPGNTKDALAQQINDTIPSWLKLNSSSPASNILGAAGSSLDTPNQYDSAAYNWLATQDTNLPEPQRPAFVSWWDYGFQAIDQGQHPSVADNFQNGIDPAGQFLLAQNESLAIAVLATTLLQAEQEKSGDPTLPTGLNAVLARDGVNLTELHNYLVNESNDYSLVVGNPEKYLPVNPSTITDDNAMYLAVSYFLAGSLSLTGVARVYDDIQAYTGWTIRYAMTDSRLFPFSGSDTGIFYAPADLTGRVINSAGLPTTFFNVTVLGSDGNTYPLGQVPADVSPVQYEINYSAPFYNSMIYREYIGYNGTDVGLSGGIPGLTGAAQSSPLEPGWMLEHFQMVYHTAYVCPGVKNATAGASCFYATNLHNALHVANETNGTADTSADSYFEGGETMLAYYPGEPVLGSIHLPNGKPAPGVRVTVYDGYGIPHMTNVTNANGTFSLILPPGNDTINLTTGTFDALSQAGDNLVRSIKVYVPDALGYSLDPQTVVMPITIPSGTVNGFVYWNTANSSTFEPTTDLVIPGARVTLSQSGLDSFTAVTDASGSFSLPSIPPGLYNYSVTVGGTTFNQTSENVSAGGTTNATVGLATGSITGTVRSASGSAAVGALVSLSNSTGIVATTTSATGGTYSFKGFVPGAYTVQAVGSNSSDRSNVVAVDANSSASPATADLVLEPTGTVTVEAVSGAAGVADVPVSFVPLLSFTGVGHNIIETAVNATGDTSVVMTNSAGYAQMSLRAGSYSVYALGYAGSSLSAALGTVTVTGGTTSPTLLLNLTPAYRLAGEAPPVAGESLLETAVIAYPSSGSGELVAWANTTGSYGMYLPAGAYSVLALQGLSSSSTESFAALGSTTIANATTLDLDTSTAITPQFTVGTNGSTGFFAAAGASVSVTAGPSGPGVRALASASSAVGFNLPSSIPFSAGGYCVAASAPGYESVTRCGLTPGSLQNLTRLYLPVQGVPVTLSVVGVPTGTPVTVNLTGETPTAVTRSVVGGPSFTLTLPAGRYAVTAAGANGSVVYRSPAAVNATVAFGAASAHFTISVLPEVKAKGSLTLPKKIVPANVTVSFASPALTVSANGTAFLTGFRIAAGNYTAHVNGTNATAGLRYANVTYVNVAEDGAIAPTLVLNHAAVTLSGTLVAPNGTTLKLTTPVTLVGGSGTTIVTPASAGSFSAVLPPNGTYSVEVNTTVATSGPNGSIEETWATAPDTSCAVSASDSACSVALVGTVLPAWFNGSLVRSAGGGTVPGTLRLVGPYPSTSVTTLNATNGTFAALLPTGTYRVYAVASSGSAYAAFGRALVQPNARSITITLFPTWNAAISVVASSAPSQTVNAAAVTVKDAYGDMTLFPDVAMGTTLDLALPIGTYSVLATAPGTLHGFAGNATANATVVIRSGNVGATLALAVPVETTATAVLSGSTSATVSAGGAATFAFSVRDTGNVPITVHPVGSPAFWNFTFTIGNVTLEPGGAAVSGEARIGVPAGTVTNHAPVAISFQTTNGTTVGQVTPAPTVHVLPFYGVGIGPTPTDPVQVGASAAVVPFYLVNRGNTPEQIAIAVVNERALNSLGWTTALTQNGTLTSSPVTLEGGANETFAINLTTSQTVFVPPGSVTVSATVTNITGSTASATIRVPVAALHPGKSSTFYVTGPAVGPAPNVLPEALIAILAFVPAIALASIVLGYRWWRTRKWVRR